MSRLSFSLLLSVGILAFSSCASPEHYYLLSAQRSSQPPTNASLSIGVGPVLIPDYIDRPEMVFQSGPNKFEIPAEHRWAGSLEKTITSVVATNLGRHLRTSNTHTYPWEPGTSLLYTVSIDIHQFHAQTNGDALLDVTWRLYDEENRRLAATRHSSFIRPLETDGYAAVAATESLLLDDLASEIAKAVPQS